jgi:stearoyl-CoA desaturase (delta-9 desaturase)
MRRHERMLDPSAMVISALERAGLAWDVVRISEERQATKLVAA